MEEGPAGAHRDGFTAATRNFDWLDTIFLSVLLGSGFVLGLNRLLSTSWGSSVSLALQPENFVRLLSLVLVYIAVVLSVVITVKRKVESRETPPGTGILILLFGLNLMIMFVYLVEFAFFTVPGFVLELTAFNFLLFIGFDVVRARRQSGKGPTNIFRSYIRDGRNLATLSMTFVFVALALTFQAESDVTVQIVLVVIAIAFTILYRFLKGWLENYFKKKQPTHAAVPS